MTNNELNFIKAIYNALKKYAHQFNIKCYPPIIAQAILESSWGNSTLSKKYHNYFGLKCGKSWCGKSVNMRTMEEYTVGTKVCITDNFRVYENLEQGVKGYLDFINTKRYSNLKGVTDTDTYINNIKADGYATDSSYVKKLVSLVARYNLTDYSYECTSNSDNKTIDIIYTVIKGDTLSAIAKKYNSTVALLTMYNKLKDPNKINVGQKIIIPKKIINSTKTYTIKKGDTLSSIANKYGTTWQKLSEYNKLKDANKIYVGQVIKIP